VPEVVNNDSRSISIGLRNIVFGQYIMRATVGDAGGESSCTVTHGVVASTSSGIVIYPPGTPSATQTLIGPLMAAGKNPLEWMDFAAGESASHFESIWGLRSALASGFDRRNLWDGGQDKWGPGTVNITQSNTDLAPNNPGNKVNCSSPGTCQFFSTVCNGSGVALSNAVMFINYPAHEGGLGTTPATSTQGGYATGVPLASGETGWLVANVTSCTSNDQANINVTFGSSSYPVDIGAPKGTAFNGRNWSYSTGIPSTVLSWSTAFPSAVDFYDSGLAFYSMYYRTGLTKYLTAARFFADTHYANPMSMNKGLAYRIGNGLGAGCGGAAISSSQCNYNGEGQQQANRDLNLTSIFIRALDGKPEYWNGLRRMCGYLTASDLHVGAGDREAGYALAFVASCALADPDLMTYRPYWLSELDRGIDGYLATVCTEANEIAGRLCHGRWNGQFIYPTTGVCPEYGMRSGYSGCVGFRKPNWKARFTNGSALVTMVGATDPSLTTPSDNSKFCPASIGGPCSVPISFGPDETRGGVCVAEGAENAMTCGTSPPTTSYTPGMIITLKPPVTVDGSPAPMLNVDGQGAKAILTYSGDTAWGPKPMTADGYWALRYDGTRFVQLPILEYFYPILTTGFGYSLGTDIGRAFYWPEWTTPTTFKLKQFSTSLDRASVPDDTSWNKCNPGPTCDVEFQWDIARDIGGRAIVFHEGVILRGLTTAYEATVAAGDPDARVLSLMSDLAQWLITYGYDPQTGGLYFARNGAGCEPASAYGAMEPSSGDVACQSDINGSRLLTGEIVGGLVGTYMRETNSTKRTAIRTWMQKVMGKAFGKIDYECGPGYVEHCHDGYYMKALEETYTPGTQQYEVDKYLGFVLGFGGDMGWPSIELHTEFPRAPIPRTSSIGFKLNSIAGAATVRVSLKDQFGNVTTTDCSASPCAVPLADSSAGNLQFMLTYRNASGATLAPGQWQTLQASP
jgi:hypothetical protein